MTKPFTLRITIPPEVAETLNSMAYDLGLDPPYAVDSETNVVTGRSPYRERKLLDALAVLTSDRGRIQPMELIGQQSFDI